MADECCDNHADYSIFPLEIPLQNGAHVLGFTLQLKLLFPNGRVGAVTQQSGDLNESEALGMVRAHMIAIERDILAIMADPGETRD